MAGKLAIATAGDALVAAAAEHMPGMPAMKLQKMRDKAFRSPTLVVLIASVTLAQRHPVAYAIVLLALTAAVLPICAAHTRGGWRWRWGREN